MLGFNPFLYTIPVVTVFRSQRGALHEGMISAQRSYCVSQMEFGNEKYLYRTNPSIHVPPISSVAIHI